VSRRAALPGASELFRATSSSAALAESPAGAEPAAAGTPQVEPATSPPAKRPRAGLREPSVRERHDEKITVYLSADELVQLDEAKAALYRDHGLKVDRGRIVREAVAVVVGDLAAKGEASILARRIRER
jgi:hypothetical protein